MKKQLLPIASFSIGLICAVSVIKNQSVHPQNTDGATVTIEKAPDSPSTSRMEKHSGRRQTDYQQRCKGDFASSFVDELSVTDRRH